MAWEREKLTALGNGRDLAQVLKGKSEGIYQAKGVDVDSRLKEQHLQRHGDPACPRKNEHLKGKVWPSQRQGMAVMLQLRMS